MKNMIFTITHGRTGTTFLTELFGLFHDTLALHEPEPNYADIFPLVKEDPRHALGFLKRRIENINKIKQKNYIETSNVFGKSFFIPLLRLGVQPKIVLLNRNFREVAKSLYVRGSYPMRTERGRQYSSDPSFPGNLPIYLPESLSNYQLCYWGVLDSFFRQIQAANIYESMGLSSKIFNVQADDLHDFKCFESMGERFGLYFSDRDEALKQHGVIKKKRFNPNLGVKKTGDINFDNEESLVLDRIAYFDPIFVEKVLSEKMTENGVKENFK
ncbi:hypothetical protein C7446_1046 [Kushneria sinocarnis]|uniref:Sulfotransferase family protein n=1 Tax=Kushneria sinocarnis TaxID=595502 RepID=A0A420WY77_9GAMM|nr:hypothetical protein [Kushneria sinocarnis]RKR06110.1 hypothetical protein C7446_1046 [Kushneria sinocarnis]